MGGGGRGGGWVELAEQYSRDIEFIFYIYLID